MEPLDVEGQADQTPLASCTGQTAQRELSKAQDFLDDADHRLDRTFAQAINRFANRRLQLEAIFSLRLASSDGGAGWSRKRSCQVW